MKHLQELTALAERSSYESSSYDDNSRYDDHDDSSASGTFIVKGYDGLQPDEFIIDPFDVEVTYTKGGGGHTDHPYGSTTAREYHGIEVEIDSIVAAEEVACRDPETDEVVKTFPEGTEIDQIPGFKEHDAAFFQDKAEDHAN